MATGVNIAARLEALAAYEKRTNTRGGARARTRAAARVGMRDHPNSHEPVTHFEQIRTRTSCGQFAGLSCVCGSPRANGGGKKKTAV
jgi:hypothetical protein